VQVELRPERHVDVGASRAHLARAGGEGETLERAEHRVARRPARGAKDLIGLQDTEHPGGLNRLEEATADGIGSPPLLP
jgi:hypothetical protein